MTFSSSDPVTDSFVEMNVADAVCEAANALKEREFQSLYLQHGVGQQFIRAARQAGLLCSGAMVIDFLGLESVNGPKEVAASEVDIVSLVSFFEGQGDYIAVKTGTVFQGKVFCSRGSERPGFSSISSFLRALKAGKTVGEYVHQLETMIRNDRFYKGWFGKRPAPTPA